jgi:23S rRNA (cytidine1920-2'-O)/16S rRNA (cytidine1409-2'-O)-methyltransferase
VVRRRLDVTMVERGLVASRTEASRLIGEGGVLVSGAVALSSSRLVDAGEAVVVRNASRWVGRGAEKMDHAVSTFALDVTDRHVLDAGSSTGGFTDCLLQRGAAGVVAVDVGRNQLHEKVRSDPRVVSREGTDIRSLRPADLPFPCSLVVADLSFISLTKVMAPLLACASPEPGHPRPAAVLLVKPQFEVGHREASRGRGIITDPTLHEQAIGSVAASVRAQGATVEATTESPVKGAKGNTEFLMLVGLAPIT